MNEFLILMKLNPGKIVEVLETIRNFPNTQVAGVNLCYAMNIFGAWDVGLWINAENSGQVLEFKQKKVKAIAGVTEVYTVPTFPHGNTITSGNGQESKIKNRQETPLKA